MSKIYIRYYSNPLVGNYSTLSLHVTDDLIVSKLKDMIFEKIRIHPSQQKLTTKIADIMLVTMTNDWDLKFFNIKENSIIFLEFIQKNDKNTEIQQKLISRSKKNYLKSLGIFNKLLNPGLGVIVESQNEYNDEIINKNKEVYKMSNTYTEEETTEIVIEAVRNNNLQQFKELFTQYENIRIDSLGKKSGWNALHYACYHGFMEIAQELIVERKANILKPNSDGWTPLHLCCHKGHVNIVRILLSKENENLNMPIHGIGTPLHCACKKNHVQVVSLLLIYNANFKIKDSNGLYPIDLTSDVNIKKLIKKCMNCHQNNKSQERTDIIEKYPFLKNLSFIPPKPPRTRGYIYKTSKIFASFNKRYIEIDPVFGSFRRYLKIENYPHNPIETIPLIDIIHCKKVSSWSNNASCFEIMYKSRQIYKADNEELCNKWIERINAAIIYHKFWKNLIEKNSEIWEYYSKQSEIEELFESAKEDNKISIKEESKIQSSIISNNVSQIDDKEKHQKTEPKKRRKNPFSQTDTQDEEEENLTEDSSLTKGINFSSFEYIELLGQGSFGKVLKVKLKSTGKIYAMKILNKKNLMKQRLLRYAVTECNVLKKASHPFIVTLHYAFQTPDFLYMVIDYCPGGDLSFHINKNLLEENEAKFFIAELVLALEHLHNMDVIYRDLKPENILIDESGHIKLADFGLAKENVADNNVTATFCGSNAYLSPEMVNQRGVGKAADIYGIGAILFEMLTGLPPFFTTNLDQLFNNISKNELKFPDYFSNELKSVLKGLTHRDPKKRLGVQSKEEIKKHAFFKEIDWKALASKNIEPPINLVVIKNESESENIQKSAPLKLNDKDYDETNQDINRVIKYTFVRTPDGKNAKK